jgi:hypothetical protein
MKPFLMGAGQGFCFQFCDVAKLAIIHKKIQPNLAIDQAWK